MKRDNWFLVLPTIVLGIVATVTLYRMHGAADVRKAVEIVNTYQADGRQPLGDYLGRGARVVAWDTETVSSFYGTLDVICRVQREQTVEYRWRVDVIQQAFAPADEATRALMHQYDPELFANDREPR